MGIYGNLDFVMNSLVYPSVFLMVGFFITCTKLYLSVLAKSLPYYYRKMVKKDRARVLACCFNTYGTLNMKPKPNPGP